MIFSLTFIGTGMFVKTEVLQVENLSDTNLSLRINKEESKCDSIFTIKSGETRILREKKTLKNRKKEEIEDDFLTYLEKISVKVDSDSIQNILNANSKYLINKKEKKTIFALKFYSE